MSHKASSWAFDQPLKGNLKLLLLAIADCHSDEMGAFPKTSSLCKKASISHRTYKRLILELEELGYVKREERFTEIGRQTSNYFTLNMGEGCQAVTPRSLSPLPGDTVVTPLTYNVSNNYMPEFGKNVTYDDYSRFDEFWAAYPRKIAVAKARKSFMKLNEADQIAAVSALTEFPFPDEKRFIPYPSSWLNARRWEDETATDESDYLNSIART